MVRKAGALAVAAAAVVAATVAIALPADAAAPDTRRGLTVTGTHVVRVAPDTAEWSFGVQARAATARGAMAGASRQMRAVVGSLRKAGVARKDIRTQAVSLYPQMSEGSGKVDGYHASTTVSAVVRTLARAGSIVEAAVAGGATEVYGPSLTRADADAQYAAALDGAYEAARGKAERLAAKVGVSLGAVVAVVEAGAQAEPYHGAVAMDAGGGEAVAVEPGQTGISASVTVTFAIS